MGNGTTPSNEDIVKKTNEVLEKHPCKWQVEAAASQLAGKHTLVIAPTGGGKTLPFWIPLLFQSKSLLLIVTPLNALAKQHAEALTKLSIEAIALNSETNSPENLEGVLKNRFRVIVLSPEYALTNSTLIKHYESISSKSFPIHLIIDEAHTILTWNSFRRHFANLSTLKNCLPPRTIYYLTSASLTSNNVNQILDNLSLSKGQIKIIHRSNARFNLTYCVRPFRYSQKSKADLFFLLPADVSMENRPRPFLIYFPTKAEAQNAWGKLRSQLPEDLRKKIIYFHSDMSKEWQENMTKKIMRGEIWGACASDSLGMGIDLPGIEVVVQWKATHLDLNTLIQRFGRGGRDLKTNAFCILLAEADLVPPQVARPKPTEPVAQSNPDNKPAEAGSPNDPSKRPRAESESESLRNVRSRVVDRTEPDIQMTDSPSEARPIIISAAKVERPEHPVPAGGKRRKDPVPTVLEGTPLKKAKKQADVETIDSGIASLIEAGTEGGVGCRRVPIDKLYGNDKLVTPTPCCDRCNPRPPIYCCDLCSPEVFAFMDRSDIERAMKNKESRPRAPRKEKDMELSKEDRVFQRELITWLDNLVKNPQLCGDNNAFCDGEYLMGNDVIERLVLLRRKGYQKVADFASRAQWSLWGLFGEELFEKVIRPNILSNPKTLATRRTLSLNPPLQQTSASTANISGPPRAKPRCKLCQGTGHNSRSCVRNPESKAAKLVTQGKENVVMEAGLY